MKDGPRRSGPVLVRVPGPTPARTMPVAPEQISAHHRVVAGPGDVPMTGDAPVDEAMDDLRVLLAAGPGHSTADPSSPAGEKADEVAVLTAVHETLARRLADASG